MPRTVVPLSDTKCEAAKPREREWKLSDGEGLFLLVKPTGVKTWRFKYVRPDGREGLATFGKYPALSLKAARERRAEAKTWLVHGKDPVEEMRAGKRRAAYDGSDTFKMRALEWHAAMARKWTEGHAQAVLRRMEMHLFPALGSRSIGDIKVRDLLAPLKAVEQNDALHLAARLRQYCTAIMRHAVQHGFTENNPARDLVGATATGKTKHRPALPLERLPDLLQAIGSDRGRPLTILALRLSLLVFIRSSELRFARWSEIDLDRAMWTIPAEREEVKGVKNSSRGSKMRTPHLVPLSRQALNVIQQVHQFTGPFDFAFAGDHDPRKPMSENTVNKALRRMGFDTQNDVCGHGFRTMACSSLVESGLWSRDAVERQMSHQERSGVRAAYIHKAEHLDERRLMVQWWADYLDANSHEHVTPYDFAHRGKGAKNIVKISKKKHA
ncbi:MAG: phage integrase family protein [Verrucomicrobiaceae bacterium]|nr:phage integrase family protein [Verrucomicrobiaceae bacterium]